MRPLTPEQKQRLVDAFYEAAIFQKHKVEYDEWKWCSNFLREYARARSRLSFSNNWSPIIMDEVVAQHPELGEWIKLNAHQVGLIRRLSIEAFKRLKRPKGKLT